ncbi:hypothetical protein KUD11_14320 [Roseovarius sp. LXJ103]|uniref:hypothetical protein n=1 Tax=Roseovarius carneus TaxID=2853164 RepID=UPI000D61A400|nr:hypothetical protein [Roseovarius carneus]MBZ8119813.1 hypothetical protein [Roseovarius carneus]PWE34591.1 hypothetical protein DD563_00420 [Pelagicola sp. LXJ1103]
MGYAIELTEDESEILSGIEFDQPALDHEQYKRQGLLVLRLLKSLVERSAIPEARLRYWSDPEYQIGRSKASHKGLFERNGRQGDEIYTHPHFLKYLRYFLYGANLPEGAISEFERVIGNPEWVSSGDITDITKGTRDIVRRHGLKDQDEEFFRLALDVGLDVWFAKSVRDSVKQVR